MFVTHALEAAARWLPAALLGLSVFGVLCALPFLLLDVTRRTQRPGGSRHWS
jgi:hypothetical protein